MAESPSERIIYLQRSQVSLGLGETSRDMVFENYYQAEFLEDGRVRLALLDNDDNATGLIETVTKQTLESDYQLALDYFETRPDPKKRAVEKKLAVGRGHLEKEEYNSAEYEFDGVIKMDQKQVEAHLGKGQSLVGQGDIEGAKEVFASLAKIDELYDQKNKHIFNTFGITLRGTGLHDQAIAAFAKALKLDPGDENLYYNMARAYYEKGDPIRSERLLKKTLGLNNNHPQAQNLLKKILA